MQISNESRNGAVHIVIVREAKFKELEPVTHNRSVRNLRAVFLQYPPVNIINVKIKTWIVTVPFERP